MPFFGTVAERVFWKKNPKHRNIYKSIHCCAPDFSPQNTLGDGPAFWIFFQDSRIRVKNKTLNLKGKWWCIPMWPDSSSKILSRLKIRWFQVIRLFIPSGVLLNCSWDYITHESLFMIHNLWVKSKNYS